MQCSVLGKATLPVNSRHRFGNAVGRAAGPPGQIYGSDRKSTRLNSSPDHLVCRLLLEKKKTYKVKERKVITAVTKSSLDTDASGKIYKLAVKRHTDNCSQVTTAEMPTSGCR